MRYSGFTCLLLLFFGVCSVGTCQVSAAESDPETSTGKYAQFFIDPAKLYGPLARYDVLRNGKRIGKHSIAFDKVGNRLEVEVNSTLAVRYLGVPVYRYSYTAIEQWIDGRFHSVESQIHDNYRPVREITARKEGRLLRIRDRGVLKTGPLVNFPSNHWNPAVVGESIIFHTLHGRVYRVNIADIGTEKIELLSVDKSGMTHVGVINARHYRYSGGFKADVWYDEHGRWVRLSFKADDDSQIDYRCVSCYKR